MDEELEVKSYDTILVLQINILQLVEEIVPQVCVCENCPDIPVESSKCCNQEIKVREMCEKENVGCVTKVQKISLVWDKVLSEGLKNSTF